MSDCLIWRSSVLLRHKQFPCTWSAANRVQRSFVVEALNCWTRYKDHASVSYITVQRSQNSFMGIRQQYSRRVWDRNSPYLACILWLRPLQLVTWALHLQADLVATCQRDTTITNSLSVISSILLSLATFLESFRGCFVTSSGMERPLLVKLLIEKKVW